MIVEVVQEDSPWEQGYWEGYAPEIQRGKNPFAYETARHTDWKNGFITGAKDFIHDKNEVFGSAD